MTCNQRIIRAAYQLVAALSHEETLAAIKEIKATVYANIDAMSKPDKKK